MSAHKSRWILSVSAEGVATVRDVDDNRRPIGDPYAASLDSMGMRELARVALHLSIRYSRQGTSKETLRALIDAKLAAPSYVPHTWTHGASTTSAPEPIASTEPNLASEPEPEPTSASGSLDSAFKEIVERFAPQVDPTQIAEQVERKVMQGIDARMREIDAIPVRVEIVTPERVTALPDTHHAKLTRTCELVARGHHVFLSGPAGSGKSTIAEQVADALGSTFHPMSCAPDMLTSKLFGGNDAGCL